MATAYVMSRAPAIARGAIRRAVIEALRNELSGIDAGAQSAMSASQMANTAVLLKANSREKVDTPPPIIPPVQVYGGNNLREHQEHIYDSFQGKRQLRYAQISFPIPQYSRSVQPGFKRTSPWLTRGLKTEQQDRAFLKVSSCGPSTSRPPEYTHCDEYPYNSTLQGGNLQYFLGYVSTKLVSASESGRQGWFIKEFYARNGIFGLYPIATTLPFSFGVNSFFVLAIGPLSGYYDRLGRWNKLP